MCRNVPVTIYTKTEQVIDLIELVETDFEVLEGDGYDFDPAVVATFRDRLEVARAQQPANEPQWRQLREDMAPVIYAATHNQWGEIVGPRMTERELSALAELRELYEHHATPAH